MNTLPLLLISLFCLAGLLLTPVKLFVFGACLLKYIQPLALELLKNRGAQQLELLKNQGAQQLELLKHYLSQQQK